MVTVLGKIWGVINQILESILQFLCCRKNMMTTLAGMCADIEVEEGMHDNGLDGDIEAYLLVLCQIAWSTKSSATTNGVVTTSLTCVLVSIGEPRSKVISK
jgi:hypothetical protein